MRKSFRTISAMFISALMLCGCTTQSAQNPGGGAEDKSVPESVEEIVESDDSPLVTEDEEINGEISNVEETGNDTNDNESANETVPEEIVLDINVGFVSLEKVGEIDKKVLDNTYSYYGALITASSEGDCHILDCKGNVLDETCDVLNNELRDGLRTIIKKENYPSSTGLVDIDTGEVLIPCEAAKISLMGERYLYVIYITEEVTDEKDAFIYFTDSSFTLGGPDDDDVLYAGYGLVYDTYKKSFVNGMKIEDGSVYMHELGNKILCCSNGTGYRDSFYDMDICDENGEIIERGRYRLFEEEGYIVKKESGDGGKYCIYDEDMNLYDVTGFCPDRVLKNHLYVVEDKDSDEYICDSDGNIISDTCFDSVDYQKGNIIQGIKKNDETGEYEIIISDCLGNVIAKDQNLYLDTYDTPQYKKYGCLLYKINDADNNTKKGLIYFDGTIIDDLRFDSDGNSDLPYFVDGEKIKVYLWNEKEYREYSGDKIKTFKDNNYKESKAIFSIESGEDKGVYSALDGTKLADLYTGVICAEDYIYICTGDVWEIYKLNSTY